MPILSAFRAGTGVCRHALVGETLRAEPFMADKKSQGYLGALLGGLVAVAAVAFLLSGGEWGGKKKIQGDGDLPPIASSPKAK
jgi:hypothetical protein